MNDYVENRDTGLRNEILNLTRMVQRLSGNLDLLTDNIYSRMDKLENSLENKLVHIMAGVIGKRMNTEMKNLIKECDDKIQDLKRDFC
ncbi:hypothetical protein DPMN_100503 [Dreissena polymorpha]|uniref:Uncharacterized protein n=1 Tax=Dreissena polymorpha TaxID=45954 RepID=A0A9D4LFW6_DREPO|nr:hypothetical protein DPMN_100503 [Dreissena polymorpha]